MNEKKEIEIQAAAFRRLVEHLDSRRDVQNIDLMNLAGFCRNCLSENKTFGQHQILQRESRSTRDGN